MTSQAKTPSQFSLKHGIVTATLLLTLILLTTSIMAPASFMMSFANAGLQDTILRVFIVIGLVVVLVSRPPRSAKVRFFLGVLSSVILVGTCASMVDYRIGLLDTALYAQASIILALEAIETQASPVRFARTAATN